MIFIGGGHSIHGSEVRGICQHLAPMEVNLDT